MKNYATGVRRANADNTRLVVWNRVETYTVNMVFPVPPQVCHRSYPGTS
jgi:hypothetical protein